MLTSLSTLRCKLLTMQSEAATALRERAACLLTCAQRVHETMEQHAPGRKTGWLLGSRAASFRATCNVISGLTNAAKGVWQACKQDRVAFEGACLRVALARLHRKGGSADYEAATHLCTPCVECVIGLSPCSPFEAWSSVRYNSG